jgi:hypothetical protein
LSTAPYTSAKWYTAKEELAACKQLVKAGRVQLCCIQLRPVALESAWLQHVNLGKCEYPGFKPLLFFKCDLCHYGEDKEAELIKYKEPVDRWDCTSRNQLTHSSKAPGSNPRACPLTHREKPVTNFALSNATCAGTDRCNAQLQEAMAEVKTKNREHKGTDEKRLKIGENLEELAAESETKLASLESARKRAREHRNKLAGRERTLEDAKVGLC